MRIPGGSQAKLVGTQVRVNAERDTSKRSFLDLEPVGTRDLSAGKRIKRGWFRASDGRHFNADINRAFNTVRKGAPEAFGSGRGGCGGSPCQDRPGEWAA